VEIGINNRYPLPTCSFNLHSNAVARFHTSPVGQSFLTLFTRSKYDDENNTPLAMAGFDLANLDRSALQQRIALHEQHEDSLGSLPDLIDESNSSYPATTSGANTTSEGESSRDEIGRRDRGKENQSPTVGNVSEKSLGGKTEVSLGVIV
jgi:hypothetical protein